LIHILLHPALRLHDPGDLGAELTELCADAQRLDLRAELSSGLYLLARLHHWGWGDIPRARALMQRALDVLEVATGPDVDPILEGARCLAYLEIDMERTTQLFQQLAGLHDLASRSHQYQWGLGLVLAWNGDVDGARDALRQAIALAAARDDHWAVFECSARLALLEIDAGISSSADSIIAELTPAAARLGPGGSESTFAAAIATLQSVGEDPTALEAFMSEIAALEALDARFLVADLLSSAAHLALRHDRFDDATTLALRAIEVATDVDKPNEAARAHAVLACVAASRHQPDAVAAHVVAARTGTSLPARVEHLLREAEGIGATRA
jgi:tetratricopeptide (TPR) repeat protein